MTMSECRRLVLVCAGNICRSPLAEHAARRALAARRVDDVVVASFGLIAIDGDVPSAKTLRAGAAVGLDLRAHRAQRLRAGMLQPGDFTCTMESAQLDEILRMTDCHEAVKLLGTFAPGASIEIGDPEDGDERAFNECARRIIDCVEAMCDALVHARR